MNDKIIKIFMVVILVTVSFTLKASEEWPSSTLQQEYTRYGNRGLPQLQASIKLEPQPYLVETVWVLATRASPVDNRAYLMALAIDLYNTLPPDLMPEPPVLGPDEDPGEYAFTPFKRRFYSEMSGLGPQYAMTIEMKKERWASMEKIQFLNICLRASR